MTLEINGNPVEFCIDTGAEVTVVSEQTHERAGGPPLTPSDRTLRGPDTHVLPVLGQFAATLKKGSQKADEKVYVVEGLNKPLLGRPAIEELGLLSRINAVRDLSPIKQFPLLFQGLGRIKGEYTTKLVEGAKPFSLATPRGVALPRWNL